MAMVIICTNLENSMTINEDSRYDTNTEGKDDNGNHSNHQMKTFEALDVAIHNPSLCVCVHVYYYFACM